MYCGYNILIFGSLTKHVGPSIERLSCCLFESVSYCENTNESHNCIVQDPRPLPRHITAGLRERCPVRHISPLLHRLEMVQRSAATLQQLQWLPVRYRIEYKDTRYCVSGLTRSDANAHRLCNHAVRAASHPAICRPRVASGSSAQSRTFILWTPLILPCRTNSVERTT